MCGLDTSTFTQINANTCFILGKVRSHSYIRIVVGSPIKNGQARPCMRGMHAWGWVSGKIIFQG